MIRFLVPPGIGDISWVYSKVADLATRRKIGFQIAKSFVPRGSQIVDLFPNIANLGFSEATYPYPMLIAECNLEDVTDGLWGISANPFLESGMKLHEIWPKQKTDYHYKLNTTDSDRSNAEKLLEAAEGEVAIGIYCSSTRHAKPDQFWDIAEWFDFTDRLRRLYPKVTLYFLGANYDNKTSDLAFVTKVAGHRGVDCVGKLCLGETVEVIRRLNYFFSFPSGLAILANVVRTPCHMWYFHNNVPKLLDTYADPADIESGHHLNQFFCSVDQAWKLFEDRGAKWIQG